APFPVQAFHRAPKLQGRIRSRSNDSVVAPTPSWARPTRTDAGGDSSSLELATARPFEATERPMAAKMALRTQGRAFIRWKRRGIPSRTNLGARRATSAGRWRARVVIWRNEITAARKGALISQEVEERMLSSSVVSRP